MSQTRPTVSPEVINAIAQDLLPLVTDANMDSSDALSSYVGSYGEASMGYIISPGITSAAQHGKY
jgi:hypothetical protein